MALIVFLAAVASAQTPVAVSGDDQAGQSPGDVIGGYNISQSLELGYRFASVGGDDGMYRASVNYRDGVRLLSSFLAVQSLNGHGVWFDSVFLSSSGLRSDPYQSATLRVEKNRIYRYDLNWRLNDYFNPGLTVASGLHQEDTTHKWQDHELTLFPQSAIRIRAGYDRVTLNGPVLSTEEEFNSRGSVYPLFENLREQYNEYRLGFDGRFRSLRFTLQRRWEFYRQDSPGGIPSAEAGAPPAVLTGFQTSQPVRGQSPGWMGNLTGEFRRIALNARATYISGRGNFLQNEFASGVDRFGAAQNVQVATAGNGVRPAFSGDLSLTLLLSSRLTVVNNASVANTRTVGNNAFTELNGATALGTTVNFQYLGILRLTGSTDIRYRFGKKLDAFTGFRYADRRIRSVQDVASLGFPLTGIPTQQSNRNLGGVAGANWTPLTGLRLHAEGELGSNSDPFTPISLRDYHVIRTRAQYRNKTTSFGAGYQENYNNNSISVTSFRSHSRNYSADASWTAKRGFSLDLSYSKLHLDTIGGLAFFAGSPFPSLTTGIDSIYVSNIHSLNAGVRVTVLKRADLYLGYNLTKDAGDGRASLSPQSTPAAQVFYNIQTFPLTYQSPQVRLSLRIAENLRWNAGYQYYGYAEEFGLLPGMQNYRANTGFTSLVWSF